MVENLVGQRIAMARGGMKPEELAKLLNVSEQTIKRWEANKFVPNFYDIIKISRATNRSLDWLAGLEPEDSPQRKMDLISDLLQWASKNDLSKIRAVIELLKK